MASGEFAKRDYIIDNSAVKLLEIIGKGASIYHVWSAELTLPSGKTCKVAAKKVSSVHVKEAQLMKQLKHRNIITLFGIVNDAEPAIIMELAENGNLRHYLDECRTKNKMRLPKEMVWKWVYEAGCGLNHLHEIDHTHRDIKSLNYLIMKDFTIKLGDMGLATMLHVTRGTSGMRGTCRWMAPEVIKQHLRSVKSDVFSYGTVVWEICTTDIPYSDKLRDYQVMDAICSGQRPVIPEDVPQQLKKIIHMCWDDDHHHRPDMGVVCKMLHKYIQEEKSLEELSNQLQQVTIDAADDDVSMETGNEAITESKTSHSQAPSTQSVVTDDGSITTHISPLLKSVEGMPSVNLSARNELPSTEFVSPDPSMQSTDSVVAMYKWCAVPRGVCLIINNMDFTQARDNGHKLLHDRKGSEVDSKNLHQLFTKFKFDVRVMCDMTATNMRDQFMEIGSSDHSSVNAFICCILTHGKAGKVAGCDGNYIPIFEIFNHFTKDKCPSLSEKPKLFFIQACQAADSSPENVVPTDAATPPTSPVGIGARLDHIIPNERDFLVSFATVPGHVSYRNTEKGSWFINALVDRMKKLHEREDLMSILTAVNDKVSRMASPVAGKILGQVAFPAHTLCRKVYFTKWETLSENRTQASCNVGKKGGKLSVQLSPENEISLTIPEDALPDGIEDVSITMSLYQEYEDYPDIDANHLMITPIVSCRPEGIEFKQPAILTFPHSVPRFRDGNFEPNDGENVHLWFQARKERWQKLPSQKPQSGSQPFWLREITKENVVLDVKHFCNFALSAGEPADMTILMYMQPSIIDDNVNTVYVSVYAVQENQADVLKQKLNPISVMCAMDGKFTVLPNGEKLDITLKEIKPCPGWEPADSIYGNISYKKLQRGNDGSRCEFIFERNSAQNPKPSEEDMKYTRKETRKMRLNIGTLIRRGVFPIPIFSRCHCW
ncbi:uncharacterized protein [Amphiura filiformis]|uniref:uncharacterized protein n=1 Tax=Amphiura filiformis TaxID=82378 RepID=UPI003B2192E6